MGEAARLPFVPTANPAQEAVMPVFQAKPATKAGAERPETSAEHHTKAAECCDKAAEQHRHAAKSCAIGDHKKAGQHAQQAQECCMKAQDHGKQAMAN